MSVLSDTERSDISKLFQSDASKIHDSLPLTKADIRAVVNAADDWVDSNTTAYNNALPLPGRTALTTKQKAQILTYVVKRRFELG